MHGAGQLKQIVNEVTDAFSPEENAHTGEQDGTDIKVRVQETVGKTCDSMTRVDGPSNTPSETSDLSASYLLTGPEAEGERSSADSVKGIRLCFHDEKMENIENPQ
ncbi:uncharacterized protein LOC101862729 [Aplysia californica]|uniref:Uncharacterized protein LOC101862729 n=1 Tax=Aplysia californica TaxID=6500 RepID=A0ABM1A090_APLCA|nr:uncharacterized protein LOC101862729 [Aplysia californica]